MPQPYNNAVITDAGLSLLDRVQAGAASIQFTRMVTGDGTYTAGEKAIPALQKSTGLKSEKNSYALSSVSTAPDGGVKLTALFTNQDPATGETLVDGGYYINEIGLFAKGTDSDTEVLYSITVAAGDHGDHMPPYEGGALVQIVQEYNARVSNTTGVTIDSAGAVMLAEDAQREFEDLKRMIGEGGAIEDKVLTFEEAKTRENIASGEKLDVILGKIEKIFADLEDVAFSGSYNDLTGVPDIPLSLPADGGDADSISGKDLDYIMDYDNLKNKPDAPTASSLGLASKQSALVLSTDWTGTEAPYSQTVTVPGVAADSIVDIDVQKDVTAEQLDAYINAKIVDGGQSADSITLKAFGEKPAVAIPIKIVVRGS